MSAAVLERYLQLSFRCSKEQAKAMRLRAHTAVREAARERAAAVKYGALMLLCRQKARRDKLRPRSAYHIQIKASS